MSKNLNKTPKANAPNVSIHEVNLYNEQKVQLEDNYEDILVKAMRGLNTGKVEISKKTGFDKSIIETVLSGKSIPEVIKVMAGALELYAPSLLASASNKWFPQPQYINSCRQFNLPFGGMRVNSYLVWDEGSRETWLFDTGPDAYPILAFIEAENLLVSSIFLTHTHQDHIACLTELLPAIGKPEVFVHESEPIPSANLIREDFETKMGTLSLSCHHTHGHSIGGMTYVVNGLDKQVAIVGDALFAGSMGGGMVSYADALRTNREKIMSLPDETVLCPGHGPMTTVGEEKKHNPFFPEFKS